jgi:tRNA (cytidine32/guanosine34-2'-O)-methyltransferase
MGRFSRDKRDIFYRLAKEKGYRARSAFKLLQIDRQFALFGQWGDSLKVRRAVDLCAAPGSWSRVLVDRLYDADKDASQVDPPRIVAVDLQAMTPMNGVLCIQGDITSQETACQIIDSFHGHRAELVVCDGAPDVTGLHDIDEYLQGQLLLSAMMIATHVLCPGGTFVAKIFRGRNVAFLYEQLCCLFERVSVAKPSCSRNSSLESFVVCQRFVGDPYMDMPLDVGGYIDVAALRGQSTSTTSGDGATAGPRRVAFVACDDVSDWAPEGQEIDADMSYPVESDEYIAPIAPPIEPPYQTSLNKQKTERRQQAE